MVNLHADRLFILFLYIWIMIKDTRFSRPYTTNNHGTKWEMIHFQICFSTWASNDVHLLNGSRRDN